MSNILAIAHKELHVVLRLADRLHRHRLLRAALRLLLRRHPRASSSAQSMQMGQMGGPAAGEHQPADDPAALPERDDPHAVPAADDHDADLLRGEAVRHDRAAADLAAHRLPDHHRQVPRRDGALRGDARGDADPHRHPVRLRQPRVEADRDRLSRPAAARRLLHLGRPVHLEPDEEPDRRRHRSRFARVPAALDHQLDRQLLGADGQRAARATCRSSTTSTTSRRASSTRRTSSTT